MAMFPKAPFLFAIGLAVPALAAAPASPTPKISMAAARTQALKIAPGHVDAAEYEYEDGHWRYSFDIRQADRHIQEVGIDAMTGAVLENAPEGKTDKD